MVSPKFLLDTNILSEPLKPRPDSQLLATLQQHRHEIATAAIVWHELRFGCLRLPQSKRREAIEAYLALLVGSMLPILPYDFSAAEWHSLERSRLSASGKTPPFADGQIAAIAKVNNLTLVTANLADFQIFDGIQVQSWMSPRPTEEPSQDRL
jgi:tRNA(fMet)-specific endonuclease VapC